MIPSDAYFTINQTGSARHTVKMSRFLAFAIPVASAEQAKDVVKEYQNQYHDSRHVCWAYMLGPQRAEWQLNDNGEPSGTAGKPILGQINSRSLTDVLVIVVRYFGGIKLGTPGLIAAYKEAAAMALEDAGVKVCRQMRSLRVEFGYETADKVMKIIKDPEVEIVEKSFDNMCSALIRCPLDKEVQIKGRLGGVEGVMLTDIKQAY